MLGSLRSKGIKMYSISRKILRSLPSACPLCGLGARGGDLCAGCAQDLIEPLSVKVRCKVCFDVLSTASVLTTVAENAKTRTKPTIVQTPQLFEIAETIKKSKAPETLGPALSPTCSRCELHPRGYASLVAAIDYAYPGDMLIQRFKEGARLAYAGLFARLLWGRLQAGARGCQLSVPLSALVPIPSSQSALKRRGFNPAGELARELARLSGYSLRQEWLIRTRESDTQKTLNAPARRESVAGLYVCRSAVPSVWIGLVDDVVTTGNTMDTAARALLSAGAAGVVGLAAAHTPRAWQNAAYD